MNIFDLFKKSSLKICDEELLEQYIQFCCEKALNKRVKGKTALHHILPKKLFPEYSDLSNNKWNGVHLLYSDHYIAHSLLHEAIDNISISYAWFTMNNMDLYSKNVDGKQILGAEKHQQLMEKRSRIASDFQKGKRRGTKV